VAELAKLHKEAKQQAVKKGKDALEVSFSAPPLLPGNSVPPLRVHGNSEQVTEIAKEIAKLDLIFGQSQTPMET
jgi:hypothetical protein